MVFKTLKIWIALTAVFASTSSVASTKAEQKTKLQKPKQPAKATHPTIELAITDLNASLTNPPNKPTRLPKYVKVQIQTPDKKRFRYRWTKYPHRPFVWYGNTMKGTILTPSKWFTKPGTYTFTIRTPKTKSKTRIKLTGKELKTRIVVAWKPKTAILLGRYRFWQSITGVRLDDLVFNNKYKNIDINLYNDSNQTVFSNQATGGIEGFIEHKTQNGWVPIRKGGICGMVGRIELAPKKRTLMIEHSYFDNPKYPKGRYRFVARYLLKKPNLHTKLSELLDIHVVTKAFNIPFKPTGKPNSTTTR